MIKIIPPTLTIILAITLIILLSTRAHNPEGSLSKLIAEIIHETITELSDYQERSVDEIIVIIRKLGHFIEYFLLGTVTLLGMSKLVSKKWLAIILSLMIILPLPFIDELILQARTFGRSPQYLDIGIDLLGILMSFLVYVTYKIAYQCQRE